MLRCLQREALNKQNEDIAVLKKVRYALCPMPYALCPMPYALCPVVPHLSEKGYILGRGDIKPEQLFIPDDAFTARLGGIFINDHRPASV